MEASWQVKITQQAQEQMQAIFRYIVMELKAPDAALHLLEELETSIQSLAGFPRSFALTDEEPWHSQGVHRMPVKRYLIYYWIDEAAHKVQVIAVIYQKRDQARQLSQTPMD